MTEKYLFTEEDAVALCEFLHPMLSIDMKQRARARDMLNHAWLNSASSDDAVGEW